MGFILMEKMVCSRYAISPRSDTLSNLNCGDPSLVTTLTVHGQRSNSF